MPDNYPRAKLGLIIQQHGHRIIADPKRCKAILADLMPEYRLEINLLITALEENIASELLKASSLISPDIQVARLAKRLKENRGIEIELAYWACESWALALAIKQQPLSNNINQTEPDTFPSDKLILITEPSTINDNIGLSIRTRQRIGKFLVNDGIAIIKNLSWCRFVYGQSWQNDMPVGSIEKVDWQTAFVVTEEFNRKGGYAGFTDWRLPTINELKVLFDRNNGQNGYYADGGGRIFLDTRVFPLRIGYSIWSSTPDNLNRTMQSLSFHTGSLRIENENRSLKKSIRFVRSEKP